ncbi:hypothetical protein BOS5A_200048 [Bosea sp. EC-HK365B]|nr:hypothetical protein BOSE21B_100048 [Bosea sp. 21B]CAD5286879.1 hypothetical protein BOSE7B_41480 [Bosea sp. 7B]CAD5301241.1 hypothetical protein BOSE46_90428 [Bosea sp. 46]VVT57353.1 hypothetical protein BOS5A_200048 [Bosea sp. EC-HK365B]VXC95127.1 hypothetical protein BOSE127_80266 [Bosea sp. 127]VXC95601.1 hypothetical protein BOSE29B_90045 [Bosea sp. 29B]
MLSKSRPSIRVIPHRIGWSPSLRVVARRYCAEAMCRCSADDENPAMHEGATGRGTFVNLLLTMIIAIMFSLCSR